MQYKNYKFHELKSTTPVTFFKCSYCGKEQYRRTSKIKNPNLIFCDNHCRAQYVSKLKLKNNNKISDKDIKEYLGVFKENIKCISYSIATKSKIPNIQQDLEQQAPFVIYKCLQNSKFNIIKPQYFSRYYKRYLQRYILQYEYSIKNTESLDYFLTNDKNINISCSDNIDNYLDKIITIKNILSIKNLPVSSKIAIDKSILNFTDDELRRKYNMTQRQINYNKYAGIKILLDKIKSIDYFRNI